ncbi:MAG: RNase adapter RapZ [Gammaproteobacteria bacterium]|nr:RNase adapter RapZ [Gammaproteobacteria bacterium]MCP4088576.1 RNase adapter RapZ [Gammaproteobacteria bacterium]MCP4276516.1 RNase adapter RapZ [Gammaproteobacteria bacterium]MCP4832393.1 RNase adapter RapZ [Gammaproteobacteria bacterium]MCP4929093.1 RNase adapter RapZ [Gammaproteobacteria bacterium]
MRLIIVSGLSGSGKSVALDALEDMGFYCIDNIPVALLGGLINQPIESRDALYKNMAVGVDARNQATNLESLPDLLHSLKNQGVRYEIVFLHAEDQVLLKRYRETRRPHPLRTGNMSLLDAILKERELLGSITCSADLVIDTTNTSIYELRESLSNRIGTHEQAGLSIQIESFGFKHGIPFDADFVFDVRCLPNPYWEIKLRPLDGRDEAVQKFLAGHDITGIMYMDIINFLHNRIPEHLEHKRNYLTIAIGCTGGQHRSVYLVEKIVGELQKDYPNVIIRHNELPAATLSDDKPTTIA